MDKKNLVVNYRPVLLLPTYNKVFERFIYSSINKFLSNNNLLSQNQSEFRPGDSCYKDLLKNYNFSIKTSNE